jgi:hypothetical protein
MYDTAVSTNPITPSTARFEATRRRFLGRIGAGSAALGAIVGSALPAGAQPSPSIPRRHALDDWMDALPTAHRMVFDAITPQGADDIRHYASNVFAANQTGYGVESRDVGVIVILRHDATPYAFNDAMWAKYGTVFASEMKINDAKANPANAGGERLDSLSGLGAHFGVCAMATRRYAGLAARGGGGTDAVFEELAKNLIRNAHLTPAGIIAVGRAQEHGYAFGYGR